jgi:hypothetical protein
MVGYNKRGLQKMDGSELGSPEIPLLMSRSLEALDFSDPLEAVATDALVPRDLVEALMGEGAPPADFPPRGEIRAIS